MKAVRGGAPELLSLVADGGRLATITGDPPQGERGILVVDAYVVPDGPALEAAVGLLLARRLTIPIAGVYGLSEAALALEFVAHGRADGACAVDPRG